MRATLESWVRRPIVRQAARFAMVGLCSTAIHYTILVVLAEAFAVAPVAASTVGFLVSLGFSYCANRRFTFASNAAHGHAVIRYGALYGVGMLLNGAIMAALIGAGFMYMLAQIVATGIVLVWNFAGARWLVFGASR